MWLVIKKVIKIFRILLLQFISIKFLLGRKTFYVMLFFPVETTRTWIWPLLHILYVFSFVSILFGFPLPTDRSDETRPDAAH